MAGTYSAGYDPNIIQLLKTRTVEGFASFLLPYLQPDMRVLDCGCGPGTLTAGLAEQVKEVVGVDISLGLLEVARQTSSAVRLAGGNTYALPFTEATFDAVFAHAVLYHLDDPHAALREMYRVLRPGGVIGIRDADFGGSITYPSDPLVEQAEQILQKIIRASGGNPHFGREQGAALRAVGFQEVSVSASFDVHATREACGKVAAYLANHLAKPEIITLAVENGWASGEDLDAMQAALRTWSGHPDALSMHCRFESVAWK